MGNDGTGRGMVNDLLLGGENTADPLCGFSFEKTHIFDGTGLKRRTKCLKQLRTALLLAIWLECENEGKVARGEKEQFQIENFEFQMSATTKLGGGKEPAECSLYPGRLRAENHASVIHPIYGVVLRALDYVHPGLEG